MEALYSDITDDDDDGF